MNLEKRKAYKVLVETPEGKRPLRRPIRRWVDIIKMDLKTGRGGMNWIDLAQDRDQFINIISRSGQYSWIRMVFTAIPEI
jgi:hypothetical protein